MTMQAVSIASFAADAVELRTAIAEYLAALKVAGRSPRTIAWYADFLREFVRFLERRGSTPTLADLSAATVRRYILAVQARSTRPLAPSSVAGRVRTLRAFGTWVALEYDLPASPVRGVPVPRVPDRLVRSLREPEVQALIGALEASQHPERDRALVLLLLDTGLRLAETAGIRIGDLDLTEGRCRVLGKGARERTVPVGRATRRALRRWLGSRGSVGPGAPLFVGRGDRPLQPRAIQQLVRRLATRAGIATRCSPHVLRHTFARSFLANGGDVFSLQRILGHSPTSLQVTRRYVDLIDDDLRAVHRAASPVDRLG